MRRVAKGPVMREDVIQRAVISHLIMRGRRPISFFHVPNGGKRESVEAGILKGLGVRAGVPDLFIFRDGHAYALELKSECGVLSEHQKAMADELDAAGVWCAVAYGLDEAIYQLEQWHLLHPETRT